MGENSGHNVGENSGHNVGGDSGTMWVGAQAQCGRGQCGGSGTMWVGTMWGLRHDVGGGSGTGNVAQALEGLKHSLNGTECRGLRCMDVYSMILYQINSIL